jgi:hypothetical protein
MEETPTSRPASNPERPHRPVPEGYRQGIITAITVLLGFTLAFFRFWGFEASGEWTLRSIIAAATLVVAVLLQIVALVPSAAVLLVGMLIATVVFSAAPESK